MQARLSAFFVWALVAASVMFWALRLFVSAPAAPTYTLAVSDSGPARVDLTRLFGAPPAVAAAVVQVPAISSRFQLTGVMAPKPPVARGGVALIAVDGKTPRAFHVGAPIDGELVLQSVGLRTANIGPAQGSPAVVLELPPLPPPATGVLPPANALTPPTAGPMPPVVVAPMPVAPVAPMAPVAPPMTHAATQPVPQPGPPVMQGTPEGQPGVPPRRTRGTPRDMQQQQSNSTE